MAEEFPHRDRILKVVYEVTDTEVEKLQDSKSLYDDLGFDSLDNVEIQMALEEEFDMEVPDDVIESVQTIGDLVKVAHELIAKRALAA